MLDPELDLEDAHLTRALDELARLVDAPVQKSALLKSSSPTEPDDGDSENQIPQPLPEPIPIEVPLPPTPVVVRPPTNATLGSPSENGVIGERGLLAELASLSVGTSANDLLEMPTTEHRPTTRNRPADFSILAHSALLLVMFVAGMLTERFVRVLEGLRRTEVPAPETTRNPNSDSELTGRITFKTKEGESQPDRGARILVFPQRRSGEVKLSVIGFRPSDSHADQLVANAALRTLGGSAATVDDLGTFRLPIEAGSYRLLVLSHYQSRNGSDGDPALDKFLSEYFETPEELLGRVQHQFSPLRIKGTGDVWDHSF